MRSAYDIIGKIKLEHGEVTLSPGELLLLVAHIDGLVKQVLDVSAEIDQLEAEQT